MIVNNSILPIIMNKIRQYFGKKCKLLKLNSLKPQIEELTVFIKVRIDNLNEFSNSIPFKVNKQVKIKKEKINIKTVKKYLFISLKSKLIFVKINLFIKIFFGLLKDNI